MKKILSPLLLILCSIVVIFLYSKPTLPEKVIVLSPHYDDAVLSLGGMLSQVGNRAIVASFFIENNASTTSSLTEWDALSGFSKGDNSFVIRQEENKKSITLLNNEIVDFPFVDFQYRSATSSNTVLSSQIITTIESLIEKYPNFNLKVYGPATFGSDITHPDHQLLHDAFITVARNHKQNSHITFYMYEDFPYVSEFNTATTTPLSVYVSSHDTVHLKSVTLKLTSSDVEKKLNSLTLYTSQVLAFKNLHKDILEQTRQYTTTRCSVACEVVYKVTTK